MAAPSYDTKILVDNELPVAQEARGPPPVYSNQNGHGYGYGQQAYDQQAYDQQAYGQGNDQPPGYSGQHQLQGYPTNQAPPNRQRQVIIVNQADITRARNSRACIWGSIVGVKLIVVIIVLIVVFTR